MFLSLHNNNYLLFLSLCVKSSMFGCVFMSVKNSSISPRSSAPLLCLCALMCEVVVFLVNNSSISVILYAPHTHTHTIILIAWTYCRHRLSFFSHCKNSDLLPFPSFVRLKSICSLIQDCFVFHGFSVCVCVCVCRPLRCLLMESKLKTTLTGFINEPRTWNSSSGTRCWELKVEETNATSLPLTAFISCQLASLSTLPLLSSVIRAHCIISHYIKCKGSLWEIWVITLEDNMIYKNMKRWVKGIMKWIIVTEHIKNQQLNDYLASSEGLGWKINTMIRAMSLLLSREASVFLPHTAPEEQALCCTAACMKSILSVLLFEEEASWRWGSPNILSASLLAH